MVGRPLDLGGPSRAIAKVGGRGLGEKIEEGRGGGKPGGAGDGPTLRLSGPGDPGRRGLRFQAGTPGKRRGDESSLVVPPSTGSRFPENRRGVTTH